VSIAESTSQGSTRPTSGSRGTRAVAGAAAGEPAGRRAEQNEQYLIGSLVRGVGLLQHFTRERPTLSLAEIAECSGLNRTTAYRFAYTLCYLGLLEQDPATQRYRLGLRVLRLGFDYLSSLPLVERANPYLRALRDEVGEAVYLGVLDEDTVSTVAHIAGRGIIQASVGVGARLPAAASSRGWVLLAHLPPERLEIALGRLALEPRTPYSVTSVDDLRGRLAQVRAQGYAIGNQGYELGLSSVAAPIREATGEVSAAVSVTGPSARLTPAVLEAQCLPAVLRTARAISLAMGAPVPPA
jgi:IclR family pca regulon transcriptional regulator